MINCIRPPIQIYKRYKLIDVCGELTRPTSMQLNNMPDNEYIQLYRLHEYISLTCTLHWYINSVHLTKYDNNLNEQIFNHKNINVSNSLGG